MKLFAALLLVALPALAQPAPPAPAANEDPEDVVARVRYERAVRAEFDGRREDALREAAACIEAAPEGRFAEAAHALIARLHGEAPQQIRSTGSGPRTELVITSTMGGLYLGALTAGAISADEKGTVGLLMLGTGGALLGSILGTSGRRVPQSMPQMLENGLGYGTFATLVALSGSNSTGRNLAGEAAAGAAAGAVAGLLTSPYLTGGDSGAMSTFMIYGGALPTALVYVVSGTSNDSAYRWTSLVGATAGIFAGPLVNARAHWSRGRWNLVTLGGFVGALMGGGLAVLTNTTDRGAAAMAALGAGAGLGLTGWLTQDFGRDEPRPGSAALIHLEGGKLAAGDPLAAVGPARLRDRTVPMLRLADGRF